MGVSLPVAPTVGHRWNNKTGGKSECPGDGMLRVGKWGRRPSLRVPTPSRDRGASDQASDGVKLSDSDDERCLGDN
ncbi:hypothetical protein ES702_03456 [subsurface metagenome]